MEIKKTITLNINKKGNNIVCSDLSTLKLIIGTTAISGNLNIYGVTKENGKYIIPIEAVKRRINELEARIKKTEEYLEVMWQVVK